MRARPLAPASIQLRKIPSHRYLNRQTLPLRSHRTGKMMCSDWDGIKPDILVLGKVGGVAKVGGRGQVFGREGAAAGSRLPDA